MRAWNLTRTEIVYRHDAFSAGLRAAGYDVTGAAMGAVGAGDALLIWNRYPPMHDLANRFEKAGGTVFVAENGYIGSGGVSPHHMNPRSIYALARGYHNDAVVVPEGSGDRWDALGVSLAPWRADGDGHVLVAPNRSFGTPGRVMPPEWARDVVDRLRKVTKRTIMVRNHPGNNPPVRPLADDLAGAWACVIWSSSAGVHAMVAGIPVICEAPYWICKRATFGSLDEVSTGPDLSLLRRAALQRMAHGQFHIDEIATGAPFRGLLA